MLKSTYPHEMYGSTNLNILMEALLSLTKTPLLICLNLNNCKAFFTLGLTWLILNRLLQVKINANNITFERKHQN